MCDTIELEHQCGLCKKTFKQKSSLVRHVRGCTLEPRPSARQKSCRNCIIAKSRCDLQRPECSRCNSRNIPCAYARPARAMGSRDYGHTVNSDSVTSANRDLDSGCSLINPELSLTANATTIAASDTSGTAYADCVANFTSLPSAGPAHNCLVPDLFQSGPVDILDATSSSESAFHSAYSSCGTTGTHATHNTQGHHSTGSCSGTLEAQLELDSGSPGVGVNPAATPREILGYVDSFCPKLMTTSAATPDAAVAIDPWILSLAAKPLLPDPPCLVEHSAQTLFRAFRSWPRMLAKGVQLPPIIHPLQFCAGDVGVGGEIKMPRFIGRCVTLCKMWVGQAEDSGQVVECAVRGEAETILAKYHTYDAPTLLSAIQSLMILLVILMFPSNRQSTLSVVPGHILAAIHELANHVLSTGLLLHEEASHVRPSWRVWVHMEAKRRTLMSTFFLHWAYSAYHGTRHFNCLQLGRMLAAGPKWLWQATDEKTWMSLYTRWLAQWDGKELIQAEFFLVERGPVMDPRIEKWLEDADELAILIMTIMNASQRDLATIPDAEGNIVG
ncbi:hypothetical protein F5Y12DRAFT_765194 [Xylaria sp. FL1777]|nr:hypothetical protein F5Y12DRAFT_765194 [Xylaria sp. FL1777]